MRTFFDKIKNAFNECNPILKEEFKRTLPFYILGVIANGIQAIIHFSIPYIIGQILDLLLQGSVQKEIIMNKVYLLIFVSVLSIFPRMAYRTLCFTTSHISAVKLRKRAIEHLQYVKPEYYEREDKGTYLEYISKELVNIRIALRNSFWQIGRLVVNPFVVLVVIAIKYSVYISLVLFPILIIIAYYIFRLYKELKEKIEEGRIADIELSKTSLQNTSGFSLIKLYNEQEAQIKKFEKINTQRYSADYNIGVVKNKISSGVNIMYAICYCTVFGLGLLLINNDLLTVGALTALITCVSFIISEITQSINPLINAIAYFKQSTKRYNYFFELEHYKKEGKKLDKVEKISLNNLSYSYDGINYVLENISLDIKQGEKIGIIGQVGSGKTTLMNIISGFLEVNDNQIFINDIDINKYSREEIFKSISYSTQKNVILDTSVKNNINITQNKEVSVQKLSVLSDLYQDVMEMPDKFETNIGENGNRLSGGQKQRVQIARTLSKVRDINIFDDSLSALDSKTENKVLNSIIEETKNNILIVVSNKVSSMKNMDKVYMLIDGKIYDKGTHSELLETNKLYNEMYCYEKEGEYNEANC